MFHLLNLDSPSAQSLRTRFCVSVIACVVRQPYPNWPRTTDALPTSWEIRRGTWGTRQPSLWGAGRTRPERVPGRLRCWSAPLTKVFLYVRSPFPESLQSLSVRRVREIERLAENPKLRVMATRGLCDTLLGPWSNMKIITELNRTLSTPQHVQIFIS